MGMAKIYLIKMRVEFTGTKATRKYQITEYEAQWRGSATNTLTYFLQKHSDLDLTDTFFVVEYEQETKVMARRPDGRTMHKIGRGYWPYRAFIQSEHELARKLAV